MILQLESIFYLLVFLSDGDLDQQDKGCGPEQQHR